MKDLKDTIDNGESEVQITTIGKVVGTGPDGEPVEQNLTEDALKKLAEKHKDDEILVDQDHESETTTNTEAKGWLSGIKFIPGKGLWGKIKWTDIGRKLVENRVFRWLSPSWYLNKDTKEPLQMTSVALTNKPSQAGRIEPIVNSAPVQLIDEETIKMELTKEELIDLIKQIILDLKKEKKVEELDKAIDAENDLHEEVIDNLEQEKIDVENGVIQNSKPEEDPEKKDDTEKAEEVVDATNACDDTEKVESTNTDPEKKADEADDMKEDKKEDEEEKKEEVKETDSTTSELDKTEDPEETEEEEEEVIKIEALNATPKTYGLDVVKNTGIGQRKLEYPEQGYAIVTKVN